MSKARPQKCISLVVKRALDIVGSLEALILLTPLFIVLYFLIRKDGGKVLFLNKRLCKGGREFYCLKFRTMVPDAEMVLQDVLQNNPAAKQSWDTHRKIKSDPRVTRTGRFLRKYSLDELPQLLNILKGDMSLVGPRPILPDEAALFKDWQLAEYYSVKPGMTGLWQVSGRNNISFQQRIDLDMQYINNWSISQDLVIICKTFSAIINGNGDDMNAT